jgi:predicted HicB family RNase H-like nuclease
MEMAIMREKKAALIYLERETHERIARMALEQRVSMSEFIRRAIDFYVESLPKPRKAVRK